MEFTKENVVSVLNDCAEYLSKQSEKTLAKIKENSTIKDYLKGKHDTLEDLCMFLYDIVLIINKMTTTEDLIDKENINA